MNGWLDFVGGAVDGILLTCLGANPDQCGTCVPTHAVVHPDRTLRRNRKPVLKTLLLPHEGRKNRV